VRELPAGIAAGALGVVAVVDAAIAVALLAPATASHALGLVLVHASLAVVTAMIIARSEVGSSGQARGRLAALAAMLALFAPVVGVAGLRLALHVARRPSRRAPERWVTVSPHVAPVERRVRRVRRDVSLGGILEALRDRAPERADRRFQAVLRAKHLPPRAAARALKLALKDPADEVRLFAFSRLERARGEIERRLRDAREALPRARRDDDRARLHLWAAEAHWEIAYLGLAEGAVLEHALSDAIGEAAKSASLGAGGVRASAEYLRGRALLVRGEPREAAQAFELALAAGHAPSKVLPYLAECAFLARDVDRLRTCLERLRGDARGAPLFADVMEVWR
jgi:tetratricopeptide (TPR) repeat protein